MTVHVNAPQNFTFRTVGLCYRCKTRRRQTVTLYQWYGPNRTCCTCGARTIDGERRKALRGDDLHARNHRKAWPELPNRSAALAWLNTLDPTEQDPE